MTRDDFDKLADNALTITEYLKLVERMKEESPICYECDGSQSCLLCCKLADKKGESV